MAENAIQAIHANAFMLVLEDSIDEAIAEFRARFGYDLCLRGEIWIGNDLLWASPHLPDDTPVLPSRFSMTV